MTSVFSASPLPSDGYASLGPEGFSEKVQRGFSDISRSILERPGFDTDKLSQLKALTFAASVVRAAESNQPILDSTAAFSGPEYDEARSRLSELGAYTAAKWNGASEQERTDMRQVIRDQAATFASAIADKIEYMQQTNGADTGLAGSVDVDNASTEASRFEAWKQGVKSTIEKKKAGLKSFLASRNAGAQSEDGVEEIERTDGGPYLAQSGLAGRQWTGYPTMGSGRTGTGKLPYGAEIKTLYPTVVVYAARPVIRRAAPSASPQMSGGSSPMIVMSAQDLASLVGSVLSQYAAASAAQRSAQASRAVVPMSTGGMESRYGGFPATQYGLMPSRV